MKKIILALLAIISTLIFITIVACFLDFILGEIVNLYDYKILQAHFSIDIWALLFNLLGIGIPYVLYLIIFRAIVKKRVSLIVKGIFTALITCLFFLWFINTFGITRPNMLELNVLIPLSVFFISGFSLPFVDEFFMKKFGLKKEE